MENNSEDDSILNQLKNEEIIIKHNSKSIVDQLKDEDLNISNKLIKYKKDEVVNSIIKKKDIVKKDPYNIVKNSYIQKLAMGELKDSFRNLGVGFINGGIFGATLNSNDYDAQISFFDMNLREMNYMKGIYVDGKELYPYKSEKPKRLIKSYNNQLIVADKKNNLNFFNVKGNKLQLEEKIYFMDPFICGDFSMNKDLIVGAKYDSIVYKLKDSDEESDRYQERGRINSIVISPDSKGLLASVDNFIKLYELVEKKGQDKVTKYYNKLNLYDINEYNAKQMPLEVECVGAGKNFIAATQGKDILILNEKLKEIERYSTNTEIDKMVVDSNYILTADRNNNIHLYLVNNK